MKKIRRATFLLAVSALVLAPGCLPAGDPPEDALSLCSKDADCLMVPYRHCCGTTKRAIHRRHEQLYLSHPEWQKFDDPKLCSTMGACISDRDFHTTVCERKTGQSQGRCVIRP